MPKFEKYSILFIKFSDFKYSITWRYILSHEPRDIDTTVTNSYVKEKNLFAYSK